MVLIVALSFVSLCGLCLVTGLFVGCKLVVIASVLLIGLGC